MFETSLLLGARRLHAEGAAGTLGSSRGVPAALKGGQLRVQARAAGA